tara:strand:- start:165 stop:794 length:630 start_codon:yes stop_codon:yes gene_type:complete
MKIKKSFIALSVFISTIYSYSVNDDLLLNMNDKKNWLYQYTSNDIKVYKLDNDSIPIIKLTKVIESSDKIFETILNIDNYNKIISNKKIFTKIISFNENSDTLYVYQKVSNIIPFVKNRHLIFQMFQINDNRLDWKLLNKNNILFNNYIDDKSKILSYGAGSWQIDNNILVHYYYINPELALPDFLINKATERSVLDIFKDVLSFIQNN